MESSKLSDKYKLLQRIAEGTYGEVYKAIDKNTKELVAVKKFKGPPKIGLPTSFVREHYIMTVLIGKPIPRVFDVFPCQESPVIVMEWLTMSLEQLLKSKKKYAIKEFFQQIVMAVDHLHSYDIIHRDLKPCNIMLGSKGNSCGPLAEPLEISPDNYEVKLIDYGMSREQAWQGRDMTNQVGTLYYRAPELLLGQKRYSNKIDIWAMGCIFYFMQTGTILFKGSSEIDQFKTIVSIIGTDMNKVKNQKMQDSLISMKMQSLPEGWSMVDKHINEIEFDFLKKMVVLEPQLRPSCRQLLKHPYFK